jgi:hypothetical protein
MYNGLRLDIYLDVPSNFDYSELLVYIHSQSLPSLDMYQNGYWLKTGSWNYFELERIVNEQLGEPYNNCLKDVTTFDLNLTIVDHILQLNRTYLQIDCFVMCSYLCALEKSKCGCNSSLMNFDKDCIRNTNDKELVSNTKECVARFLSEFRKEKQHEKCHQYCPLECDSMSYKVTPYLELIKDSGKISKGRKGGYDLNFETYEEVNSHFVSVLIYYRDLRYTRISQDPKTQTFDFISNIGGILGLFLGISFLSFVELFEIIFEISLILFRAGKISEVKTFKAQTDSK